MSIQLFHNLFLFYLSTSSKTLNILQNWIPNCGKKTWLDMFRIIEFSEADFVEYISV